MVFLINLYKKYLYIFKKLNWQNVFLKHYSFQATKTIEIVSSVEYDLKVKAYDKAENRLDKNNILNMHKKYELHVSISRLKNYGN